MTAISLSSTLSLVYYGCCTRQSVVIGLLLIPVYSVATALGARYFTVGGQRHSRRTTIATLATVAIATFFGALRNYVEGIAKRRSISACAPRAIRAR